MKTRFVLYLTLLLGTTAVAVGQNTDWQMDVLSGPVKTVTTYQTEGVKSRKTSLVRYTQAGQKLEEIQYDHQGAIGRRTLHVYDSQSRKVEVQHFGPLEGLLQIDRIFYNTSGFRSEIQTWHPQGFKLESVKIDWDPEFQVEQGTVYDAYGEITGIRVHIWDTRGNLAEIQRKSSDEHLYSRVLFEYDDSSKLQRATLIDLPNNQSTTTYGYNGRGFLNSITQEGGPFNSYDHLTVKEHDERGNPVQWQGSDNRLEYEYW